MVSSSFFSRFICTYVSEKTRVKRSKNNHRNFFFLQLSSPLFCFHSMLNRRPSRVEVTPEDRQEEVRVEDD